MNQQVSQFTVNEPSTIIVQKPLSLTPNTIHYKSHPQSHSTVVSQNHHQSSPPQSIPSNTSYRCQQCPSHLSNLTEIKKREIKLQYQIQTLKEQIQHLKRENQHLKQLQYNHHQKNLQKYNPIMYFKQDLQAQLYQAKYLLQLHTLAKQSSKIAQHETNNTTKHLPSITTTTTITKQSQKQQQSLQKLSKPINMKTKCQQLLLENIKLQQKLMIKEKIIEERVLFPLYHYDERVLMLRKAVEYWYRRAEQEAGRLHQVMVEVKKYQKQLKREAKTMVLQQKVYWQNQLKKVMSLIQLVNKDNETINNSNSITTFINNNNNYNCLQNSHNQTNQKHILSKTYNHNNTNNILIEDDHTIYSLCEKINSSKEKQKNNKEIQRQKTTKRNSINNNNKHTNILCQSCMNLSSSCQNKRKPTKNCSILMINNVKKQQKSINKVITVSGKNSAKNENKYKDDTASVQRKSEEFGKKILKRKNFNVEANNNNSSLLGKNFENIQIKVKPKEKEKCEINCKKNKHPLTLTKCPLSEFSCQRCAERIM